MQTIFVLIKCELGKAYDVAHQAVETIEEISEVHLISGQYDLLMKCYLAPGHDIGHFVNEKLHAVDGVKDTFTMITFKAFT
mgnify:CR=1 FL=1